MVSVCVCVCVCVCAHVCMLSSVRLCATQWTVPARLFVHGIFQARILEFIAIFYLGDLPDSGFKPRYLASPALTGRFFTTNAT